MEVHGNLLTTETVKGRIIEIDGESRELANEIVERQLAQKRLSDERSILADILRARGEAIDPNLAMLTLVHSAPVESDNRWTIQEAILHVLKRVSPKPMHSDEILSQIRLLGAGSDRTNRKNVEWNIWKLNESGGQPVILSHGPHLYSYANREMLEGAS